MLELGLGGSLISVDFCASRHILDESDHDKPRDEKSHNLQHGDRDDHPPFPTGDRTDEDTAGEKAGPKKSSRRGSFFISRLD